MRDDIEYRHVDARELAGLQAPLEQIYRRCFAGPPWSKTDEHFARFPDRLAGHLAEPGTRGVVAQVGNELAGVVYGWPAAPIPPDTAFYSALHEAVPAGQRHRLLPPALEVVELMVDPGHQGHGLGRGLLTRILSGQTRAWLCVHPNAIARRLYESVGWERLAPVTVSPDITLLAYAWPASTN